MLAIGCDGDETVYIGSHQISALEAGTGAADDASVDLPTRSNGCGQALGASVNTQTLDVAGYSRMYRVVAPETYDPERAYPVVFGFHARDGDGEQARERLQLESFASDAWIFVYPDARVQQFANEVVASGWQNGPLPSPFDGTEDLEFMDALLDRLAADYCMDRQRVFAAGEGWGGEFGAVLGCFSRHLRAFAQAGANHPYFLPVDQDQDCVGDPAVWIFHGKGDEEFPLQSGVQHLEFWRQKNGCGSAGEPLEFDGFASDDECGALMCSGPATRYCWYSASVGHDVPSDYFGEAVMQFFTDLL